MSSILPRCLLAANHRPQGIRCRYRLQPLQVAQCGSRHAREGSQAQPGQGRRLLFSDTEDGILNAIESGARVLWANTHLFKEHPLQTSARIGAYADTVRVVGHPPVQQEDYEYKGHVNALLRTAGCRRIPRQWDLSELAASTNNDYSTDDDGNLPELLAALELPFPVVAKPVRGQSGLGFKVCANSIELYNHIRAIQAGLGGRLECVVEQYLAGQETTVLVLPPRLDAAPDEPYYCLGQATVESAARATRAARDTHEARDAQDAQEAQEARRLVLLARRCAREAAHARRGPIHYFRAPPPPTRSTRPY